MVQRILTKHSLISLYNFHTSNNFYLNNFFILLKPICFSYTFNHIAIYLEHMVFTCIKLFKIILNKLRPLNYFPLHLPTGMNKTLRYISVVLISLIFFQTFSFASDKDNKDSIPPTLKYQKLAEIIDSLAYLIQEQNTLNYSTDQYALHDYDKTPDLVFEYRMETLNQTSPINLSYNNSVKRLIDFYLVKNKSLVAKLMGLSDFYFPMFEAELDKHGLPLELKYLPVIESALNPNACSRSGAVGLWQFLYDTGKLLGLNINSYVDERKDPLKSTEAACNYLAFLYSAFGDWQMALAAYNAGPGTVKKAIERSGGKTNFWDIRPYLPKETQNYVPTFLAVNYVFNYAALHNIKPTPFVFSHYDIDTIQTTKRVNLYVLAKELNVPLSTIYFLNPEYKLKIKPVTNDPTPIVLPREVISKFLRDQENIYSLSSSEYKAPVTPKVKIIHTVEKGEYLHKLEIKYKVPKESIKQWNNLSSDVLHTNQKLVIWVPKDTIN